MFRLMSDSICNILSILTFVLTGYYVHGIPSPALLQFIWLGYGTGLMMAQ
jgi:accessory gene regulator protein AgrB